MGQLNATLHSRLLILIGYFHFAFLQLKVAFFIALKSPIQNTLLSIFSGKSNLECPTVVPYPRFSDQNSLIYLEKSNLSQGICNHLLSIFAKLGTLSLIFYKEVI